MRVNVTQKHIDMGAPRSNAWCPIARALTDMGLRNILVADRFVECNKGVAILPFDARNFISSFDCKMPVKPFNFKLTFED